jgi:hypothetical protein
LSCASATLLSTTFLPIQLTSYSAKQKFGRKTPIFAKLFGENHYIGTWATANIFYTFLTKRPLRWVFPVAEVDTYFISPVLRDAL